MNRLRREDQLIPAAFHLAIACVLLFPSEAPAHGVKLPVPIDQVSEPVYIYTPPTNGGVLLAEPDGRTVRFLYRLYPHRGRFEGHEGRGSVVWEDISTDGGLTWKLHQRVFETGDGSGDDVAYISPYSGEIYWIYSRGGQSQLIRTKNGRTDWSDSTRIPFSIDYDTGSFIWLREQKGTGVRRIVVAVGIGKGTVTCFSDDDGATWSGPSNLCASPPVKGRWVDPGNAGHLVELNDGRLWMLLRNSQDHLWEYFSDDRGASWSEGRPSRFVGVFSNVRLHRLPDGRLIIVWLNTMPRSGLKNFHKTGRDVVHAAISDDDGKTWRGFREVVLGKRRHSLVFSEVRAYDAGVHHQKVTVTGDNKALVFTGQDQKFKTWDSGHRQAVIFDLDWLYATSRSTDFSNDYDDLCVFKLSRKPWGNTPDYSRVLGATLIEHPTRPFKKVLHLGREKCDWVFNEQDGANWNFPIGKQGSLEARILLRKGFKGGAISLVDVFYPPSDNAGDEAAMYRLDIPSDGRINDSTTLKPGTWHDVRLEWTGTEDTSAHICRVHIDGRLQPKNLPLKNRSRNGICYVRFRSTAEDEDLAGWLVETVKADVIWDEPGE